MKNLKLFEGFNQSKKIELANEIILDWIIFNYLLKKKAKIFHNPKSSYFYYTFNDPISDEMLATLTNDNRSTISQKLFDYVCFKLCFGDKVPWRFHAFQLSNRINPLKRYIEFLKNK